jgi:hypothetical protein
MFLKPACRWPRCAVGKDFDSVITLPRSARQNVGPLLSALREGCARLLGGRYGLRQGRAQPFAGADHGVYVLVGH